MSSAQHETRLLPTFVFIVVGLMGRGMLANLLKAGFPSLSSRAGGIGGMEQRGNFLNKFFTTTIISKRLVNVAL